MTGGVITTGPTAHGAIMDGAIMDGAIMDGATAAAIGGLALPSRGTLTTRPAIITTPITGIIPTLTLHTRFITGLTSAIGDPAVADAMWRCGA